MFVKEVLAQATGGGGGFTGIGNVGSQTVDCLVEGDARMGWAVRDVELYAWATLEEVKEQKVDTRGSCLTGSGGHLEEGLDDSLVVNQD